MFWFGLVEGLGWGAVGYLLSRLLPARSPGLTLQAAGFHTAVLLGVPWASPPCPSLRMDGHWAQALPGHVNVGLQAKAPTLPPCTSSLPAPPNPTKGCAPLAVSGLPAQGWGVGRLPIPSSLSLPRLSSAGVLLQQPEVTGMPEPPRLLSEPWLPPHPKSASS